MSHRGNQQISHAEAALGAGRSYEKPREGHNEMFDNVKELHNYNTENYGHHASKESRGERIDQELEQEDKATIGRMTRAQKQREEAAQNKHSKDN